MQQPNEEYRSQCSICPIAPFMSMTELDFWKLGLQLAELSR
jgi:hypothetical protein